MEYYQPRHKELQISGMFLKECTNGPTAHDNGIRFRPQCTMLLSNVFLYATFLFPSWTPRKNTAIVISQSSIDILINI